MHFSLIREVFRSEFGKEPSELFASFDKEAFAAASIGQVHRATYRMYYSHTNYSDPHSGNYVFMSDGRLGLLDFGCVQHFTPEEKRLCDLGEQFIDGRITAEETMLESGHARSDLSNESYIAPLRRHMEWLTAPVFQNGRFDFGNPEFFKQGIDSVKELVEKIYPAAPMYLYFFRSLFGLRVLSYQLKCRVDIRALRNQERKPWTT